MKNRGLLLKKNMVIVLLVVLLCLSGVLTCLIISNNINVKLEIDSAEAKEVTSCRVAVENSIHHLSETALYYATATLYDVSENFTVEDYYKNYSTEKQMEIMFSVMDSIGSLNVESQKHEIHTDHTIDTEIIRKNARVLATVNGVELAYIDAGLPYQLFFIVHNGDSTQYINNNVYLGINQYNFSKSAYVNDDDARQELLVAKDGTVLFGKYGNYSCHFDDMIKGCDFEQVIANEKTVVKKQNKYIYCQKLSNTDLYQINIIDKKIYNAYVARKGMIGLSVGVIVFVLGIACSLFIVMYTYKPIKRLVNQIELYESQKFNFQISESNYISNKFEELVSKNEELSNSFSEKMQKLRYLQGRALQSQINPHFIYNSLDALNWMVCKELHQYDNPISDTIHHISHIIHSSIDNYCVIHTVQDEIELLNIHISVLNAIYDHKFRFHIDCDERILNNIMLKLSVQPLVENAISHAFLDVRLGGDIYIRFSGEKKDICVSVTDNGIGMKKDKLQELLKNINAAEEEPSAHVGLRNTNLRLKYIFGEKYGLFIESKYGEGTTVRFKIPRETETDFHNNAMQNGEV